MPDIMLSPASPKQEAILNSTAKVTLAGGAAGSGKALRHGEKVLTPNGFINIEDCKVGQEIVTPRNSVEKIVGVFPQGVVDNYRVTFQDGSFVDTCGDHLWKWRKSGTKKYVVSSTTEIKTWMDSQKPDSLYNCKRKPLVDLIDPVDFSTEKVDLPISPYLLGVLLGDGSITTGSVSFVSDDDEIAARVMSEGYSIKQWQLNDKRSTAKTWGVHKVQQPLRDLGLLGLDSYTKFIPDIYKKAPVAERFALVQGLMDTDGYVDAKGCTEFCTISPQLKEDMCDVLRSLGFTCSVSEKTPFYRDACGNKIYGQKAYSLYIRGKNQPRLFSLSRKVLRCKVKKTSNAIVSIEYIGKHEATCISITGEEKLFITSNFIPTHNTYILCLVALRFMQDPNATGIIFRRTTKQINTPGGIWSEAVRMYKAVYGDKLKIKNRDNEIIFPNGALLKFSHLEHESNIYDHQGGQYSFVAFDEGTHFTRPMVTYMLSRMRNARVKYKPQMFITCNPDADHWLKSFVDYCLDENGIPVDDLADRDRFFVFKDDQFIWADKREDLENIYGKGEESGICSFRFYPARCTDNPPLLKAQPDYISNLKALGRVEEARLLWGSWTVRAQAAGLWKRDWVEVVDQPNGRATKRVRAWDLACTLPSELNRDPDYTAGVLMSVDKEKYFYIEDVLRFRDRHQGVERTIIETAYKDGFDVEIRLPREPGSSGLAYVKTIQQKLANEGFNVRLSDTNTGKVNRFAPFASSSEAGFVKIVKADWNDAFFAELEAFDGSRKGHDDMCDGVSDAHKALRTSIVLPNFTLPDFSGANPFNV